ncbi:MAG TPA: glycosyl hydrolase family 5, partial [Dysgonomonas sp.]|nr:glycosyl hydrolase family 5 [Dysgonomonas sp.]
GSCMVTIPTPDNWSLIVEYTKADRSSFAKIREARPDQELVRKAMTNLLENMKFNNCIKNEGYIKALGMKP